MAHKEHVTVLKGKDEISGPLKKATAAMNSFVKKVKDANTPFTNTFKAIARFGKELGGVGTAGNVVRKSFEKVIESFKALEAEWAEAEKATKKIDFAAAINKNLGASSTELKDFAGKFASSIRNAFSQDELQEAMGPLLFDKTGEQIKKIIPVAADLSVALGESLGGAVKKLNESLSGSVGELGNFFPELKKLTKEQLEAGKAIDIIKEKVSGLSKDFSNSAAGSIKNYKDATANLREELGAMTTDVLTPMRDTIAQIAQKWADALAAKRQYAEAETAVAGGTADSLQYSKVLDRKEKELEEAKADLARLGPSYKEYQYKNYISKSQYEQSKSAAEKRVSDLYRETARLEIDYSRQVHAEEEAERQNKLKAEKDAKNKALAEETAEKIKIEKEEADRRAAIYQDLIDMEQDEKVRAWEEDQKRSNELWNNFDKLIEEQKENERLEKENRRRTLSDSITGSMGQLGSIIEASVSGDYIRIIAESIQVILSKAQGISEVISSVFNTLDTAVNEFIGPVVRIMNELLAGFLPIIKTIGRTIGIILELLEPVIYFLASPLKTVLTVVVTTLGLIYNAVTAIYNLFHRKDRAYFDFSVIEDMWKDSDSVAQHYGLNSGNGSETAATASASYTAARDVYVTINYNQSYVNGDAREIALNLRNEIRNAEALGY